MSMLSTIVILVTCLFSKETASVAFNPQHGTTFVTSSYAVPVINNMHNNVFYSNNNNNNKNNNNIDSSSNNNIYDVITDCGAKGNGVNDDTSSIQSCLDTIIKNNVGSELYFPPGNYLITSNILIENSFPSNVYIHGSGLSSILLWSFDNHLFYFKKVGISRLTLRDIAIYSTKCNKSYENGAFYFDSQSDLTQSVFDNLLFSMTSDNDNKKYYFGSGILMNHISDTLLFNNILMWFIHGIGIKIGYGSEVRIINGRIIGIATRHDNSIGIFASGNNGGIHIINTDVIGLDYGLLLNNSNGQGSNREIFISQATFDSDNYGIAIADSSYVNINGIWAASSDTNQIWIAPDLSNPILVISGGTIFNGGVYGGNNINCDTQCNGITVNSGTFILNDVAIRNNKGKGIWIPNNNVVNYVISGCKIFDNNIAYEFNDVSSNGENMLFSNNICNNNGVYKGNNQTLKKLRSVNWRNDIKDAFNVGC